MSEAPVLLPIFPYADEGGARPSSFFDRGTESLKQIVSRFLMKKLRRRQNLRNKLSSMQDFFD